MFNLFPYTDMHELNLDWIIKTVKEYTEKVDSLVEEAIEKATEAANAYTDEQIQNVRDDFITLSNQFDTLQQNFNSVVAQFGDLESDFALLINELNDKLFIMRDYIDAQIQATNNRTDALFVQNNNYILSEIGRFLREVTVLNYFTGTEYSIQDMFDYLAQLHVSDSITYSTMNSRAKTYTEFINMNMTYTNLVLHGNTLYV